MRDTGLRCCWRMGFLRGPEGGDLTELYFLLFFHVSHRVERREWSRLKAKVGDELGGEAVGAASELNP